MVLEHLNLHGDDMYVILDNIIFRLTQMDTDNAVMEKRDKNSCLQCSADKLSKENLAFDL